MRRAFTPSFFVCLFASALLSAQPAKAHPHAWIDVQSKVLLNAQNDVVGLREHWVFDEYYSAFALEDFDPNKNGKLDPDELMALADENLKNLADASYFTTVKDKGVPLKLTKVTDVESHYDGTHVVLDFTLPFPKPQSTKGGSFFYRIYDPSYYVSMLHLEKNPVLFEGPKASACHFTIETPTPDITKIQFAASIDQTGAAPDQLGLFFAQKVSVTCD